MENSYARLPVWQQLQTWKGLTRSCIGGVFGSFLAGGTIGLAGAVGLALLAQAFWLGLPPQPFYGRRLFKCLGGLLAISLLAWSAFLLASALVNLLSGSEWGIVSMLGGPLALIALLGTCQLVRFPDQAEHRSRGAKLTAAVTLLLFVGWVWMSVSLFSETANQEFLGNSAFINFDQGDSLWWHIPLRLDSGTQQIHLSNRELSWHTFTIDALGVNVLLPYDADRLLHLNAPPGVYEFYCAIPGHREAGEVGTLTVAEPTAAAPN